MRVLLTTRVHKTALAVLLLSFASAYAGWVLLAYRAARFAARSDRGGLQRAIALEPGNAEYYDLLGTHLFYAAQDLTSSITQYKTAASLNPYVARYWLDLARAYLTAGDVAQVRASLAHAVAAEPRTLDVLWEAANDYLVIGATDEALPYVRTVLQNDPSRTSTALNLCWRMIGDVNLMMAQALPRHSGVYLAFVKMLVDRDEGAAAAQVWSSLLSLRQKVPAESAFPYVQYLIQRHEVASATAAWRALPGIAPNMQQYMPSDSNLIVNGQFAEDFLNAGFDWRYQAIPHVKVTLDEGRHDGQRSVAVAFDGDSVNQPGIYQLVALEPDTRYEFSAWVRTDNLLGVAGPRLAIQDAYGTDTFFRTDSLSGTTPWNELKAEFTTPHDASLGALRIAVPGTTHVGGTLWITDLRLTKLPAKS